MARTSMSVVDVAAWVNSTGRSRVESSRISNIYRLDGLFLIKLHTRIEGKRILVVEPGKRVHFTRRMEPGGESVFDSLTGALRKHLRGKIVRRVLQVGWDRVLAIEVPGNRLVVELMKNGFLVLVDEEDHIIVANAYRDMKDRTIRPKTKYLPPPSSQVPITGLDKYVLMERVGKGRDLVRGMVVGLGLPGEFAEEAIYRVGLDKGASPSSLSPEDAETLVDEVKKLYLEAMEGRGYTVKNAGGLPVAAVSFKPTYAYEQGLEVSEYGEFDEALDELFAAKASSGSGILESIVKAEVGKLLASIERHRELVESYKRKALELEAEANIIAQYYAELEKALEYLNRLREREGWNALEKVKWIDGFDPRNGRITLKVRGAKIRLSLREQLKDQLNALYRRAGELRGKAERAEESLKELEKMLEEARERGIRRYLRGYYKKRPRDWFERYHWSFTRNGFLVIAGKNADQNESIVKKYLEEEDLFLHAEIHGAPATILKTRGRDPSEGDILDAAVVAAVYSRAWKAGAGSVDVFWVKGSQVSKSPPSGEYVSKGAFMVYGKKNYVRGVEVKAAVGLEPYGDGFLRAIAGSTRVVAGRSFVYAEVYPGDRSVDESVDVVKRLMCRHLSRMECIAVEAFPEEELSSVIPGRTGRVRAYRGETRYEVPVG